MLIRSSVLAVVMAGLAMALGATSGCSAAQSANGANGGANGDPGGASDGTSGNGNGSSSSGGNAGSANGPDGGGASDASTADGAASPSLALVLPSTQFVDEEKSIAIAINATGGVSSPRVFVEGLPPGASFDEASHTLSFTPDFTQGGTSWSVQVTASDGITRVHGSVQIVANDTIIPLAPTIASSTVQDGYATLNVSQVTDSFLDSAGYAGRAFNAIVIAPTGGSASNKLPVRVGLHGFDGTPETDGWSGEYRIFPADPNDTYWWGYADSLPNATSPTNGPTTGTVPEYTARRVLHLLEWLLATYPGADPERVYLDGVSMGGAGVMTMGLLHARHFCHARASFGQAIPRNHRPSRIAQLTQLWGSPASNLDDGYGMGMWDRTDLTRVLRDVPEAHDQFLTLKHSKDDSTIHFGAVTMPSPLTNETFYAALQQGHIGHHAIWDEGGHLIADPVLGDNWWTAGWDPVFDTTSLLLLHRAFPAFSSASIDRNPGTGNGNGKQPWNAETGFAGNVTVPGDTGWDGDIAGGLNRFLRWDGTNVVDTLDQFSIPVRVIDGVGGPAPRPGYPTTGDKLDGVPPVLVDVTPRRVQSFRCRPGEMITWTFGSQQGTVVADATGAVTVPRLSLTTSWATLTLMRAN